MYSPSTQYNGIVLADEWPPRTIDRHSRRALPVPYLEAPPDLIPIDGGRQLFVDDFLVASTTLKRSYHAAKQHPAAPVLSPETEVELNGGHCPVAAPFNDGVWYDPADGRFKLWYHAGWFDGTALATSRDGLHWERPALEIVPGTNLVIPPRKGHRRDGFHWHRPERTAFIACSRQPGTWDYGYIHAAGGVGLVVGDELFFYYGAWSGQSPKLAKGRSGAFQQANSMYAGGSTGLAVLRRDGFASFGGDGSLTTRPVEFSGRHLFVNVDAPRGELRVEILDPAARVIAPFSAETCRPIQTESTRQQVVWQGGDDLSALGNRPVRFRFHLRGGELYSFWVSASRSGASGGYIGAGGPGFSGNRDL